MNFDLAILVGALLAIVCSLVWSRASIVGPVMFAWAGASAGGFFAFVCFYNEAYDRVDILAIIPAAMLGAAIGSSLGMAVRGAYIQGTARRKAILEAISGAAFLAGLGLIYGWIGYRFEENTAPKALAVAGLFGVIGAGLAVVNWRIRRRPCDGKQPQ